MGMEQIEHMVLVMRVNRSFDHTSTGSGPVRSDMAESLAKATQVHAADERQDLLRQDR